MKKEFDVCCIGNMCTDIMIGVLDSLPKRGGLALLDHASLSVGGCGLNTSIGLSKLGVKTTLLGKVGQDEFGHNIKSILSNSGVNIDGLKTEKGGMSSLSVVLNSSDNERTILHYLGTNASFCFEDIDMNIIEQSSILFIGGALLMPKFDGQDTAKLLKLAKEMGLTTAMDTAWDSNGRWLSAIEPCLPYLDWFMPSVEEAEQMLGTRDPKQLADGFMKRGAKNVVIKNGSVGIYAQLENKETFELGICKVECVDTSGAGDAWCAGFIAGLVKGIDVKQAAKLGAANAALCITEVGTTKGLKDYMTTLEFANKSEIV